jgi:uncharacterized protein (TIGR02001 family)
MKTSLLVAAALALLAMPVAQAAGFYGDGQAVSNFVWRGISQSNNNPALQGGGGYDGPYGLYASVWGSTMDRNDAWVRADLRGGMKERLSSGFSWNFGVVAHRFNESALNFNELYLRLGIGGISGRVSRDWQQGDTYLSVRDRLHLGSGFRLILHAGHTSGAEVPHYTDVAAGLTKRIQSWNLGLWTSDTDLSSSVPGAGAHLWLSIGTLW